MSVWVPGLLEVGTTSVSVSVLGVEYGGPGRWDGQDTRLACRPPPSPKSLWATTPGGGIIISTTHSLTHCAGPWTVSLRHGPRFYSFILFNLICDAGNQVCTPGIRFVPLVTAGDDGNLSTS